MAYFVNYSPMHWPRQRADSPQVQPVLLELRRMWVIEYECNGDAGARHLEKLMRGGIEMQVLPAGCVLQTCQHIGKKYSIGESKL